MARKSLALLAALLALVFFGSVMCPPVDERGAPPAVTVGDADTLPPPAPVAGIDGTQRESSDVPAPATTLEPLRVPVVDDQGAPLDGARVDLERITGSRAIARAISGGGEAAFLPPGPGDYLLSATAEGHLPAAALPLTLPLTDGATAPVVRLPRAALVHGTVEGLDGNPVVHGEILLRETTRGVEQVVRAHGAGIFDSGPLPTGSWEIAWREHPHAAIDPRLLFHRALGPGEQLQLAFTIEAAGRVAAPGRLVGVVETAR